MRELSRSGIRVHRLGMGCWAFGGGDYWGAQSQTDVNGVVARALDAGVNFFDTAEMYNNGASEAALGIALKGRRHEAVVATKIAPSNCREMEAHLDASLRRLQTDCVDLYMLQWPVNPLAVKHFDADANAALPSVEEMFRTLRAMQQKGKIRAIGVSNFGVTQLKEALAADAEIAVNEIAYNIVSRAIEAEIVPFCMEYGISIVGSMALQQGLLAGIYARPEDIPPAQAHFRHFAQARGREQSRHGETGAEREIFALLPKLREIAGGLGISMAALSIAWALRKPFVAAALAGARNARELEDNLLAAQTWLPDAVMADIDALSLPVWQTLGDSADYYENRMNTRIY